MRIVNVALAALTLTLAVSGCISLPGERFAVIDKAFLDELIAQPSYWRWDENCHELMYLLLKGDRKAIEASMSLMGAESIGAPFEEDVDEIAVATYNNADEDFFWQTFSKQPHDCQLRILRLYDHVSLNGSDPGHPQDWEDGRDKYLNKHPGIAEFYKKMDE